MKTTTVVQVNKRVGVAYILWLLLGTVGGHRFYLGRIGTAMMMLGYSLIGWAMTWVGVGWLLLGAVWLVWVIDAFLIPSMASRAVTETWAVSANESRGAEKR